MRRSAKIRSECHHAYFDQVNTQTVAKLESKWTHKGTIRLR